MSSEATDESIGNIVLLIMIILAISILAKILMPLLASHIDSIPNPEPEEIYMDISQMLDDDSSFCLPVAKIGGQPLNNWKIPCWVSLFGCTLTPRKKTDFRDFYMIKNKHEIKANGIRIVQYGDNIIRLEIPDNYLLGFFHSGITIGRVQEERLRIYPASFSDKEILSLISFDDLKTLDYARLVQGTIFCNSTKAAIK